MRGLERQRVTVGCCAPRARIADAVEGTDITIMGNVNAIDQREA